MMPPLPKEPWQHRLFARETPVEIILVLARAFVAHAEPPSTATPDQGTLDTTIAGMLAAELYRRNADYREIPWSLRLHWTRITGLPDRPPLRRPKPPRPEGEGYGGR